MPYHYAFFDLDGTLTDSAPGILNSVEYALTKMGYEMPPRERLMGFIGPPLSHSFENIIGLSKQNALRAVDTYREYYAVTGVLECEVYDGIVALLERLTANGTRCVLATCKPHVFAKQVLAHFGLDRYFCFVSGPEIDGTRGEKHEVITHALEQLGQPDPKTVLMIGDRAGDVIGATQNGMDCAGVLWGFGSAEELQTAGAKYLCSDCEELYSLFDTAK